MGTAGSVALKAWILSGNQSRYYSRCQLFSTHAHIAPRADFAAYHRR